MSKLSSEWRIYLSLAIAAHMIAYLLVGGVEARYVALFFAAFTALVAAFWAIGSRLAGAAGGPDPEQLQRILAMDRTTAKRRALDLLADPQRFRCTPAVVAEREPPPDLPAAVRDLFERYDEIAVARGESRLKRAAIGHSKHRPGFVRIGVDFDDTEVVARPHEEPIYEVDGTEPPDYQLESYPTVYHWLVAVGTAGDRHR